MAEEKMVETIKGVTASIDKCRKFENGYYLIGSPEIENSGDCQFINGKYYRMDTGLVVFDHEQKIHVLKNDSLYHGIVDIVDDAPVFGAFTPNEVTNGIAVLKERNVVRTLNNDIFAKSRTYRERLSDGKFYHIEALNASEFSRIKVPSNDYKVSLPYDSSSVIDQNIKNYEKLNVSILPNIEKYSPLLKDLSFGLEFETVAGTIPQRILNKTGLIPLRDGSIQGIEYVTVPMNGAKGFQTVLDAVSELEYRTKYDHTCALHMHIGNVPRTIEFILAFFKVTCAIQDEIYTLFPLYKKYNFGIKNKNYSKPFPVFELLSQMDPVIDSSNIIRNFDVLYTYLSMGQRFEDVNNDLKNVNFHPADREGRAKWYINTRYYIHNLIPLIFGNKQTIEFRIHTATLDINKIAYFMFMNSSIVNFTIENTWRILKEPNFLANNNFGGIKTIISNQISNTFKSSTLRNHLSDSIFEYLDQRKKVTERQNRDGDIRGNEDKIQSITYIEWLQKAPVQDLIETPTNPEMDRLLQQYSEQISRIDQDFERGMFSRDRYVTLKRSLESSFNREKQRISENIIRQVINNDPF